MKEKVNYLVDWLREKVAEANMNGLVVGVSGGIDSAVTAHLIKRAFPNDSLGVIMPLKSDPQDRKDALKVIESAALNHVEVDLTEAHHVLFQAVNTSLKQIGGLNQERLRMSDANLRARLRMCTLYAIANQYRYLVCGTDNAAEWYTGYFTKYGDGGVDLVPLVHFTKGQVRDMGEYLGVPKEIIEKAPSAGLWEGQTDEKELGTSYEMIDAYLEGKEIPEKDKTIIERLHRQSEHKRQLAYAPPKIERDSCN